MKIRRATYDDIPAMLEITKDAVAYLASQGVPQWQDGYPNEAVFRDDIKNGISYIIEDDGKAAAMTAVSFEGDGCYKDIVGKWLNDEPYGVIHRCAVSDEYRGRGCGDMIFLEAERMCRERGIRNLRADTHADNRVMRNLFLKHGFVLCGTVVVETASSDRLRDAYHKLLD